MRGRALAVAAFGLLACGGGPGFRSAQRPEPTAQQSAAAVAAPEPGAPPAYAEHCASCHGAARLGGAGPALLPVSLARSSPEKAAQVIRAGRPATQMPAYAGLLSEAEIAALAAHLFTEPATPPVWGEAEIRASRSAPQRAAKPDAAPVHGADPLNLFLVVEHGDHHVSVLDGDRFDVIRRFPTRPALHGGIKFSPDGRFAYLASRDGWIGRYDLNRLEMAGEVRAGLNTRNIALSADGRVLLVANFLPQTLVALDATTLELLEVIEVRSQQGAPSRVSAVYTAPPRHSFVVALKDVPELWELDYRADARAPHAGLVHDYRSDSGEGALGEPDFLPIRRIALEGILDDFFFDTGYHNLVGASRESGAWVVNLDVGRTLQRIDLAGLPHLGSGVGWRRDGRALLATPNLERPEVTVVDAESWQVVARIPTLGPGFFLRSHENSPYLWADVFFGPDKDAVHVIDKQSLAIVATLRPAPGKTSAHVEFTRDGRFALLSIWEEEGELIVYDARTLQIVRRLPMKKPSGKYNVYNKIRYAEGTSH